MSVSHKVNGTWQKTAGLPPVDSALSSTSQNPLENRQIYAALADKITASVSNLVNYYKKSETYTQAEVRQLIGAISTLSIKVVAALPTTDISATTIYWVGPDATTGKYDQYIYSNNAWVKTGDTSVNLGDYVTTEALELAISDFLTEDDVEAILASYYTKTEVDTLLNGKQNTLTFDNVPTENSTNVVKSGGVYSAVDDVYKVMGENGAKNLLPYPFYGNSTKTLNGITFTDNGDGTVTANGTATADADFYPFFANIGTKELVTLPAGKYTISGCPSGGSSTSYYIYISLWNEAHTGGVTKGFDYGEGFELTLDEETELRGFIVRVVNGQAVSNLTFKPMIRLASDTDATYQPYAMTNQQMTPYVQAISNPNLLDNPWFTVNQRGQSSYSSNAYAVDRWAVFNGQFTINSDGTVTISVASGNQLQLQNRVDPLASKMLHGKVVTLSAIVNDVLHSFSFVWNHNDNTIQRHTINDAWSLDFRNIPADGDRGHFVRFINTDTTSDTNITIKAVKLELGSVSTLANDTAPNYQQELAKCQRYFVRFTGTSSIGTGFAQTSTKAWITTTLPVPMRTQPTVTLTGTARIQHASGVGDAGPEITALSINTFDSVHVKLDCTSTGLVATEGCELNIRNSVSHLDFSADL